MWGLLIITKKIFHKISLKKFKSASLFYYWKNHLWEKSLIFESKFTKQFLTRKQQAENFKVGIKILNFRLESYPIDSTHQMTRKFQFLNRTQQFSTQKLYFLTLLVKWLEKYNFKDACIRIRTIIVWRSKAVPRKFH